MNASLHVNLDVIAFTYFVIGVVGYQIITGSSSSEVWQP